jgi:uncharacterized phage protein (TIGR01671 family)
MHFGWGCLTNESNKSFIVIDENDNYPEPVKLMQYTGLHDKNGKEIWEGDIVRVVYDGSLENEGGDAEVRQVKWGAGDEHYPAFDLEGNDMETNALSVAMHNGEIEVIGNIYENPELCASQ